MDGFLTLIIPPAIILLFFGLTILIFKLSARILRIDGVTWKNIFVFIIIIAVFNFILRSLFRLIGFAPPASFGFIGGFIIASLIGGWFFRSRGRTKNGELIG